MSTSQDRNINPVTGNPYTYGELEACNRMLREQLSEQRQEALMSVEAKMRSLVLARISHLLPAGLDAKNYSVDKLVGTAVMGLKQRIYKLERELEEAKQPAGDIPSPKAGALSKLWASRRLLRPRLSLRRLYRNWPVHNLVAHPLSEIAHWLTGWFCGHAVSGWIHDVTIPRHEKGTGRG